MGLWLFASPLVDIIDNVDDKADDSLAVKTHLIVGEISWCTSTQRNVYYEPLIGQWIKGNDQLSCDYINFVFFFERGKIIIKIVY